jgi:uncharacterized protein YeaO (DUF488 family)
MALYTARIYSPRHSTRGTRISVMSMHTLNDGVTPDPKITPKSYDEHMVALAPSLRLLGDYYKRGLPWEEFEERYRASLQENPALAALVERTWNEEITILCKEESPEYCHRRIIAEEARKLAPDLKIIIG